MRVLLVIKKIVYKIVALHLVYAIYIVLNASPGQEGEFAGVVVKIGVRIICNIYITIIYCVIYNTYITIIYYIIWNI